jgi:hypothetical protein
VSVGNAGASGGVAVAVGLGGAGTGVAVAGTRVGVAVAGAWVGLGVRVAVGTRVGVGVRVAVAVRVGVVVGLGVGVGERIGVKVGSRVTTGRGMSRPRVATAAACAVRAAAMVAAARARVTSVESEVVPDGRGVSVTAGPITGSGTTVGVGVGTVVSVAVGSAGGTGVAVDGSSPHAARARPSSKSKNHPRHIAKLSPGAITWPEPGWARTTRASARLSRSQDFAVQRAGRRGTWGHNPRWIEFTIRVHPCQRPLTSAHQCTAKERRTRRLFIFVVIFVPFASSRYINGADERASRVIGPIDHLG